MPINVPCEPRAEACEAISNRPDAVIFVSLSPNGHQRRLTVAEARALIALLEAAVTRAESGEPLPAAPSQPKTNRRNPDAR